MSRSRPSSSGSRIRCQRLPKYRTRLVLASKKHLKKRLRSQPSYRPPRHPSCRRPRLSRQRSPHPADLARVFLCVYGGGYLATPFPKKRNPHAIKARATPVVEMIVTVVMVARGAVEIDIAETETRASRVIPKNLVSRGRNVRPVMPTRLRAVAVTARAVIDAVATTIAGAANVIDPHRARRAQPSLLRSRLRPRPRQLPPRPRRQRLHLSCHLALSQLVSPQPLRQRVSTNRALPPRHKRAKLVTRVAVAVGAVAVVVAVVTDVSWPSRKVKMLLTRRLSRSL